MTVLLIRRAFWWLEDLNRRTIRNEPVKKNINTPICFDFASNSTLDRGVRIGTVVGELASKCVRHGFESISSWPGRSLEPPNLFVYPALKSSRQSTFDYSMATLPEKPDLY